MRSKFKVGDKVRFTRRVCKHATNRLRQRTRTIVDVSYDHKDQCTYYELGDVGKGRQGFQFRSYMLKHASGREHEVGRPQKRRRK